MQLEPKIYISEEPFRLELGGEIPELRVAYHTYGRLSSTADNVVWVCHALTADSEVGEWWPDTVAHGRFLDPDRYFIVCANILGSCYGTTGPMSVNPATGKRWYRDFPRYTIRDIVEVHRLLMSHLGIKRLHALVGSSVGGFQAVEWAVGYPSEMERLALIATDSKASPWAIAIDETQRMAILADPTYAKDFPEGGEAGLRAARAIGLLTYRGPEGYNITQQDFSDEDYATIDHRASTYQRHQGDKLVRRFDAYSYMSILQSFDTHNVGRGRGGEEKALGRITAQTLVVGLTTDIIFSPAEEKRLASRISGAVYKEIDSPFGHDGFLVESDQLNAILKPFIDGR